MAGVTEALVIVDGYNCLFSCGEFERPLEDGDMERARAALCSLIAGMGLADRSVVVFDGDSNVNLPFKSIVSSVRVVFSLSGSTADEEIESMVARHKSPASVRVVTSDSALAAKVKALGAKTTGVEDFLEPAFRDRNGATEDAEEPRVKFEGPGPEELKYWMRMFECEDED